MTENMIYFRCDGCIISCHCKIPLKILESRKKIKPNKCLFDGCGFWEIEAGEGIEPSITG